ncbi:hypothetical protein EOL94_02855 [bacterium]|nr:hypothetical protein [bacterium]
MKIPWKEEYNLGFKIIDNQHKEFVNILNGFYDLIHKNDKKELNENFKKIIDYGLHHFDTEEKYFKEFSYKDAINHVKEHESFKKKVLELKEKIENTDNIETIFEVVDYMEDWLVGHLNKMDREYIKCFKDNGLK